MIKPIQHEGKTLYPLLPVEKYPIVKYNDEYFQVNNFGSVFNISLITYYGFFVDLEDALTWKGTVEEVYAIRRLAAELALSTPLDSSKI